MVLCQSTSAGRVVGILICCGKTQTLPNVIKFLLTFYTQVCGDTKAHSYALCTARTLDVNRFQINVNNGMISFGFLPLYFLTASLSSI